MWAKIKREFRKKITEYKMKKEEFNAVQIVDEILTNHMHHPSIARWANKGWNNLKKECE